MWPIHTKTGATDTAIIYMDLRNIMFSEKKPETQLKEA